MVLTLHEGLAPPLESEAVRHPGESLYRASLLRTFAKSELNHETALNHPADWKLFFYVADPHVTFDQKSQLYHLTCLADLDLGNSINSIVVRSAPTLDAIGLEPDPNTNQTTERLLKFCKECQYDEQGNPCNRQVWAPELQCETDGSYTFRVSMSNGDNHTHDVFVYHAPSLDDTFQFMGHVDVPTKRWAIDGTVMDDLGLYMWSGWEEEFTGIDQQQHIYLAKMNGPTEVIGDRVKVFSPSYPWANSVMGIFEGVQQAKYQHQTWGGTVGANASWTTKYNTGVFFRDADEDPATREAWVMAPEPLFDGDYGAGHGCFEEDVANLNYLYFIGHCKTVARDGWQDRVTFMTRFEVNQIFDQRDATLQSRKRSGNIY